jgi:two-component system, OmpR family, sensor kinase
MKMPRLHSLRARLLWFLLIAIWSTATVQGVIAYRTAHTEADSIFDYHMQQMAMSLRGGLPNNAVGTSDEQPLDDQGTDFVVQVWTADGLRVFESPARTALPEQMGLGFADVRANGTTYRVFSLQSRSQTIQVAQDLAVRSQMASRLALRAVAPTAVMAPFLMLVVWWVVRASMAPVSRVRRQLAERQADELVEVSETGLPDEIRPLVRELNLLFGRVRRAFEAQRSFVADAAHELRSPLAALKVQAQSIPRASDDAARAVAVGRLTAGIDRATRLVEQLLILARQQATAATGAKRQRLALSAVARLEVADAAPSAQARRIDLGLGPTDDTEIAGTPDAIRILIRNLLDNAVKYSAPNCKIDVEVRRIADRVVLSVDDSGPGIPEQERGRVMDRFYRVAGSETTGSGLGLSIVKSIAELHGATFSLGSSPSLGGLRAAVSFPCVG